MSNLNIIIHREYVSLGDDVDNKTINMEINETKTFKELTKDLISKNYFPNIPNRDGIWVLQCKNEDLLAYVTKTNQLYPVVIVEAMVYLKEKGSNELTFKYFTSSLKRAEYIFKICKGLRYYIYHDGYSNEYDSYNISEQQENLWYEEIK